MTDDSNIESAEDAAGLNRLLALAPTPVVPPVLEHRILADFARLRMQADFETHQRTAAAKSGPFGTAQPVFGGGVPTSVICPIFRPGRGGPLP